MKNDFLSSTQALIDYVANLQSKVKTEIDSELFLYIETPSIDIKRLPCAELAFSKVISWLYIFYNEVAKDSINYLDHKNKYLVGHRDTIISFRTLFQHHLSLNQPNDKRKIDNCQLWFDEVLGKNRPVNEKEWSVSFHILMKEVFFFLGKIQEEINDKISETQFRDIIIEEWSRFLKNTYKMHEFERVAYGVFQNYGCEDYFNISIFCNKHYDKWLKQTKDYLKDPGQFNSFAKMLIEKTIIEEKVLIPLSSDEIMQELGVKPGPKIKQIQLIIHEIFWENPLSKEVLFEFIKTNHSDLLV